MVGKISAVHKTTILIFGTILLVVATTQAVVFTFHLSMFEDVNAFVIQLFQAMIDFFLPILFIALTLAILPTEISSGLIRYYVTAPLSRKTVFNAHVFFLYGVNTTFLILLSIIGNIVYIIKIGHWSVLSFPVWIAAIVATPVSLLMIQILTLFVFLQCRNRIYTLVITLAALFFFELITGTSGFYTLFPTTDLSFFIQLSADYKQGFSPQTSAIIASVGSIFVWNTALYLLCRNRFLKLNV